MRGRGGPSRSKGDDRVITDPSGARDEVKSPQPAGAAAVVDSTNGVAASNGIATRPKDDEELKTPPTQNSFAALQAEGDAEDDDE
jgi:hypothetical protein